MYTVTHVLTALIICILVRGRFSRQGLLLFALGSFLPDLDHLYMHRYLLHNIFFLMASLAVSRYFLKSFALPLGVLLHFVEDMLASDFNTLLYPIAIIDTGLELWWLYSAWFNFAVVTLFILFLVLREGFILRRRSLQDATRFVLMVLASLSFCSAKASEILLGYVEPVVVEGARFASTTIILASCFWCWDREEVV